MGLLDDADAIVTNQAAKVKADEQRVKDLQSQPVLPSQFVYGLDATLQGRIQEFVQFMQSQHIAPLPCAYAWEGPVNRGRLNRFYTSTLHIGLTGFNAWELYRGWPGHSMLQTGAAITDTGGLVKTHYVPTNSLKRIEFPVYGSRFGNEGTRSNKPLYESLPSLFKQQEVLLINIVIHSSVVDISYETRSSTVLVPDSVLYAGIWSGDDNHDSQHWSYTVDEVLVRTVIRQKMASQNHSVRNLSPFG